MPAITEKTFGFGLAGLKKYPELIPIVAILGVACGAAAAFSGYALIQKTDVRVRKSSELPPWEKVDPTQPQKLLTFRQRYQAIPELEALKKEIGSYKC